MSRAFYCFPDEPLQNCADQTDVHLAADAVLAEQIGDSWWALHSLADLVPATPTKIFSGNLTPLFEAHHELMASATLAWRGLYKQAFVSLRSVLELGLLSVFWDVDDRAEETIQNWLRGSEKTPLSHEVKSRLASVTGVGAFLAVDDSWFVRVKELEYDLGGYVHTRGVAKSSRGIAPHSNMPHFDEAAFRLWATKLRDVVTVVLVTHLLKYPVGLQITPLSDRFGLNPPAGGFVEPHVREQYLRLLGEPLASQLQAISDADPDARDLRDWVERMPSLSDEDWQVQIRSRDESLIEMQGFENWAQNQEALYAGMPDGGAIDVRMAEMREWAQKQELMTADDVIRRRRFKGEPGEPQR